MKIIQKLIDKQKDMNAYPAVNIAFLGDSITQGAFEPFIGGVATVDSDYAYSQRVKEILAYLYPLATVNIVNAGVSGNTSGQGLSRIYRDVMPFNPDLVVVCFGLNDCAKKVGVDTYTENLQKIFDILKDAGKEIIFMTPNTFCTHVSRFINEDYIKEEAQMDAELQNSGLLDGYVEGARKVAKENNIPICDCYAIWKNLYEKGVDTTELLANRLNHPTRKMQWLFAMKIVETILHN